MYKYRIAVENGVIIADSGMMANTFWLRFRGLLGRSDFNRGEALVIRPCSSVHTIGMKFPIDVLFVSINNEIVHSIENMPPYRFSPWIKRAAYVVELPAGRIAACGVKIGHTLTINQQMI